MEDGRKIEKRIGEIALSGFESALSTIKDCELPATGAHDDNDKSHDDCNHYTIFQFYMTDKPFGFYYFWFLFVFVSRVACGRRGSWQLG